MNKRKSVLNLVRQSNKTADKNTEEYKRLKIVVSVLERYFQIYDLDNGTVHSQVVRLLYLTDKYYTYNQICETVHIGKNTLVRYIAKYEELAVRIFNQLNI